MDVLHTPVVVPQGLVTTCRPDRPQPARRAKLYVDIDRSGAAANDRKRQHAIGSLCHIDGNCQFLQCAQVTVFFVRASGFK